MIYLGIDPGSSSGGVAAVTEAGDVIGTHKMPDHPGELLAILSEYYRKDKVYAAIEQVGPNRGPSGRRQGASSMFSFGRNFGRIEVAALASWIGHEYFAPTVWQAAYGLRRLSKDESIEDKKARHRAAAERLFPGVKVVGWNYDALLLADFARRTHVARYRMEAS
jgi:hypothetical protein